jgi:hypothetical protein
MIYSWARGEGRTAPPQSGKGKGRSRRPKYTESFRIMRLLKDEPGDDE